MRSGLRVARRGRCGELSGSIGLSGVFGGRSVLVTGHTGFKGSWLALWLRSLGAHVTGFALAPEAPSFFADSGIESICDHVVGDVRDRASIAHVLDRAAPEVVFHLAAQALVRVGHADPIGTFSTNVIGTANLLDEIRRRAAPCAVVIVTSDKCYRPSSSAHREDDPLGGEDPYSASKAACELLTAAYRSSYFPPSGFASHGIAVATARAGNVLGGGDWARDRIVPDMVRALLRNAPVAVRNPEHVRPWQHVLEPLSGYLVLAAGLLGHAAPTPPELSEAWNFGPAADSARTVREVVETFLAAWGSGSWLGADASQGAVEASHLRLDPRKAQERLGWAARWGFAETIRRTADWYLAYASGVRGAELRRMSTEQLASYMAASISRRS